MSKSKASPLTIILISVIVYWISIVLASALLDFQLDGNNLIFGMVAVFISSTIYAFINK